MKNWINFTGLFLLIALSSEAQYTLLLKGQPSPYDSGVVIQIKTYRIETRHLKTADDYIKSLNQTIDSLNATIGVKMDINKSLQFEVKEINKNLKLSHDNFSQLGKKFDDLYVVATKPKKGWLKNVAIGFGLGSLTVLALTR